MTTETTRIRDEAQIRKLIDDTAMAIRDKNIDGLMAKYAANVLSYDALPPLQNIGTETSRQRGEKWLGGYSGPINYESRDLHITMGEHIAFSYWLYRISGTLENGTKIDMWLRTTVCFEQLDGSWKVTHEHTSVPFDAQSGKASLDLTPE
jgi:ketosteroid isomerase-like protein